MNNYEDVNVLCPFFKRSDFASITCEGLTGGMVSKQVFTNDSGKLNNKERVEYMSMYCEYHYQDCIYARLMEEKYE